MIGSRHARLAAICIPSTLAPDWTKTLQTSTLIENVEVGHFDPACHPERSKMYQCKHNVRLNIGWNQMDWGGGAHCSVVAKRECILLVHAWGTIKMSHQRKTTHQHAMTKPIPMHGHPAHPDAPTMSQSGMEASVAVTMQDEYGNTRDGQIAAERPLTVYIDRREIVTLMTLGTQPELLILGWLRNQRFVQALSQIKVIQVDWETEAAAVITRDGIDNLDKRLSKRTVTTGCGQGTVFGNLLEDLDKIKLPQPVIKQSEVYRTLRALSAYNEVYRKAGAVHGCALCHHDSILSFVEDVGRHNAVDTIAGHMWLNDIDGGDKLFYTTGRLTSEMVIKVAQMGIPILLSRSGVTQMGLDLARRLGVILIARAKGKHFLVYHGQERVVLDDIPPARVTVDDNTGHRRPPHTGREKS